MKKILVIGATGMVASRFVDLAQGMFQIISADEKTLDITSKEAIDKYFENSAFDAVVNFAAFTNVDSAELQKGDKNGLVWKLNVDASKFLSEKCKEKNTFFVHISTDFVFPGDEINPGPYSEDSVLPEDQNGIGWYGWTKNRAEKVVSESGSSYAIVRFSYPFRAAQFDAKKDWARNLLSIYNEHRLYPLFSDQIQSVIFIDDLVEPLVKIIQNNIKGVFHLVSRDTTSPFEIGSYLLDKYAGKHVDLEEGKMADFLKAPGRTPRPRHGGLKVEITEKKLGVKMKTWREMADEFLFQLSS